MAKKGNGLQLVSDYTEELVGFALESYLSVLSFPFPKFSIEPFSHSEERSVGADARLIGRAQGFTPFYMQFKRPFAYPEQSRAGIIRDRTQINLNVTPRAFYFPLRKKKPTHPDFQHNVLFALRQRLITQNVGDACYVCPLFLERAAYRYHVHLSALRGWPGFFRRVPWADGAVVVHTTSGTNSFSRIPVLAEHVSIPPHARVTTADHSYSFSENGTDLCFHSDPVHLGEGSMTLGKFLDRLAREPGLIVPMHAAEWLRDFVWQLSVSEELPTPEDLFATEDGELSGWFRWGDFLREHHGIEQFAFVKWGND
jgi:hypothetical protein